MTEDDGYETIVPDLSITPSDELLLAKMDYMIGFPRVFQEDDFKRVVAEHRQAAYNQALEDIQDDVRYLVALADWAAGEGFCQIDGIEDPEEWCFRKWSKLGPVNGDGYSAEALASAILSLGDKDNG